MWRPFIQPPCTTWDRIRSSNVQFGSVCARVPVYCLVSSVVVFGVDDRPPFGNLGCALRHRPMPVLQSHPRARSCMGVERNAATNQLASKHIMIFSTNTGVMRCLAQPLRGGTTIKRAPDATTRPNRLHTHTHSARSADWPHGPCLTHAPCFPESNS